MEVPETAIAPLPLSPQFIEKVIKATKDLEEKGYAIIPGVFSREECDQKIKSMWQHLSEISDGKFLPDRDYAKVRTSELLPHKHGIIESWRFNHLSTIREIRRDKRVIAIFALLYGTDQLTSSIDRVNFKFPGYPYTSIGTWPHVDQHASKPDRLYIQSYVTFIECGADSPGNRFYEGSHKIFSEFFAAKRDAKPDEWNRLTDEERVSLPKRCPLVKPTCEAGSMILWDSRVVHDPDDGTNFKDGRFVVYLCYSKLWPEDYKKNVKWMEKKKAAFLECRSTSHVPLPQKMFAKCPRLYGGPTTKGQYDEIPKGKLGMVKPDQPIGVEEYLFGFKSHQGKEGLLLGGPEWKRDIEGLPLLEFVSPFASSPNVRRAAGVDISDRATKKRRV